MGSGYFGHGVQGPGGFPCRSSGGLGAWASGVKGRGDRGRSVLPITCGGIDLGRISAENEATVVCSAPGMVLHDAEAGMQCRGWGDDAAASSASASHRALAGCSSSSTPSPGKQPARARWEAEALVLLVVVAGVASHDHGID